MSRRVGGVVCALALAFACAAAFPSFAGAAFPGLNGRIAFQRSDTTVVVPILTITGRTVGTREYVPFQIPANIFSIDPSGSGETALTTGSGTRQEPAWSPDGNQIAFSNQSSILAAEIWVMRSDGSGQRQLTSGSSDLAPSFSADGTKVYFARAGAIWVVGVDGSNPHVLFSPPAGHLYMVPRESPEGTRLAFVDQALFGGTTQIVLANPDGTGTPQAVPGQNQTAGTPDFNTAPDWSPDGTRLVFQKVSGLSSSVWIVGADGSNLHSLTPLTLGQLDSAPAFSPDGQQVTFARGSGLAYGLAAVIIVLPTSHIWTINVDGSNARQITTPSDKSDNAPNWQPLPNLLSAAQAPGCSRTGAITVTASEQSGFRSPPTKIDYQIDGGPVQSAPVSNGSATVVVPQGKHTLSFWAENAAGQQEQTRHDLPVTVDSTAPHLTIALDQHRATFVRGQRATITIRATDAGGSGLVRNPSRRHRRISTARLGTHRLRFTATDACGNSTTKSLRYRVVRAVVHHHPRFTG